VGSSLSYSIGDGNWTILVSTLNPNYIPDQTTFLNWNIITNGIDDVYMWNGPGTFISSATFTKFRYIDVWEGRIIGAGVTDFRSSFYYGAEDEVFAANFGSTYLGQDDGDIIMGLKVKGNAWIFKGKSIWAAVWKYEFGIDQATQFVIRKLTSELGCLYDTSIQDFNDGLMFYSHLGFTHLKVGKEGAMTYNVVSENIDGILDEILQTTSFKASWFETSAVDFGDGATVGIDTTTVSGSILMSSSNLVNQQQGIDGGSNSLVGDGATISQTFRSTHSVILTTITVYGYKQDGAGADLGVEIQNASQVLIASMTFDDTDIGTSVQWIPADFSGHNTRLTKEATYYIVLRSTEANTKFYVWKASASTARDVYPRGESNVNSDYDQVFKVYGWHYTGYGQYQSDVYNAGTFAKSWGTFNANYNVPANTSLNWHVSIATASVFCSSTNIVVLTDGFDVPYSSVPFIMIYATMTATDRGYSPEIYDYLVYIYASEAQNPIPSMVYDDRYMASITTPTMTKNGLVVVCNSDFAWVRQVYTGIYPYSMSVYRDIPYLGNNDTGYTYEIDVVDVYDDVGSAYDSRILTGDLDFGYPNNEKSYTRAYTKASNSGAWTLDWGYNLNGSTQGITCDKKVRLDLADRIINCKTSFPKGSKAYYMKLQLQNNSTNQWFDWRGTDVYYKVPVEPIR
jgi:hypothetical protein